MTNTEKNQSGILSGRLVLDLAQLITGPYCASLLGDMGAEVIKIEPPGGEAMRHIGPFVQGQSVLFLAANRNKRSLILDLSRPAGRRALSRLIARADVLIQNFRPDVRRAYGLDYEEVRREKPDVIYLSVTAFGEEGPYRFKPGTDHIFQGASGLMSVSGQPGQGPLRLGVPAADMAAALYACQGVLGGLLHRERTGRGQRVAVNLLDAAMCLQQLSLTEYLLSGRLPEPSGNSSPFACPVGMFATADGYINIAAFNGKFWRKLCRVLGIEAKVDEPRFSSNEARLRHRDELEAILTERFARRSTAYWLRTLEEADVPCGPVHDYRSLFQDRQVEQNRLVRHLDHASLGRVATLGNPLGFSDAPLKDGPGAPLPGQHTEEIMNDFDFSPAEIKALKDDGVI